MVTTAREQEQRIPEPPGERPVVGIVVALLVLVVAALGVGLYLRSTDHAGTAPAPAAPAATAPTTPTTLAAPVLANTGDNPDWGALVRSILAYDYWLKVHPDPARQADIFTADYRTVMPSGEVITLSSAMNDLAMLSRGDLRYDPAPNEVTASIVTMQNRDALSASVFVRLNPAKGNRVVGRDGQVTQFPDSAGGPVIWRLVLGTDGHWRLAGVKPA